MALTAKTFNIANFFDGADGANYKVGQSVYVKNESGTYADIFIDPAGSTAIIQDGSDNVTNSKGEFSFFIGDGDYYIEVNGEQRSFSIGRSKNEFSTVNDAANYNAISSVLGGRVYIIERQAYFDVVLTSTVTPNSFDVIQSLSNGLYSFSLADEYKNQATAYGVINSTSIDSHGAMQAAVNKVRYLELPATFALSQPVLYGDLLHVKGVSKQNCVCFMLSGFSGSAAFYPASAQVNNPKFENITFVDSSGSNDGSGTDSTLKGIDITGTFRAECINTKGVRVDDIVFCDTGPSGEVQWTKRPKISGIDGSNVNRLFNFVPTAENRFPYGDIQIEEAYSTGSVRYGARAEDTDGFTWNGATIFPDGQLRVSGNYINISVCHPFEAKAKLTDPANITAESFIVPNRSGGQPSYHVNIGNMASAFAGRLADTTSGSPPKINKSAFGVRLQNVIDFNVSMSCNDPSEGAIRLQDCRIGNASLSVLRANTQALGSGALPSGTYDTVLMEGCGLVNLTLADNSPDKRYLAYLDDDCEGCRVVAVTEEGTQVAGMVRMPNNNANTFDAITKTNGAFKRWSSDEPYKQAILENSGSTAPSCTYGRNGALVRFDNSVSTNVTDIPDMQDYQEITVHIQDNGATKLLDISGGGNFRTKGGATILGRGTVVKFIKDPSTGELVEV